MKGNMSKVVDVICNFQITTNMVLDILKPKPNMCGEELEQVRKQFDIAKYEPLNMQDLQSLDAPWYVVRYALLADEPLQRQHQGASSSSISPQKPVLDSASSFASVQNAQGASPTQSSSLDHVQTPQPTPAITITPPPVPVEQASVNVNFNNNNVTSASSSATVVQAPQTPLVQQEQQVVATSTNNNIAERRSTHVKYLNLKARVLKAILAKNKQIYIVKNKKSYSSRKSSTPGHHHHNHHHSTSNNNHHHSNNNAADASVASSSINRRTSNGADLK